MRRNRIFSQIALAALYTLLASALPVYGQALVETTMDGKEFQPERRGTVAPDDVPEGRRFRGENRETIVLRRLLRLPAGNTAEHKLVKLIVRFRTGRNGPTLYSVAAGNLQRSTNITGDYTRQETRNVFTFDRVDADLIPIRLTLGFAGGIDSIIPDQEFILTKVDAFFPVKAPPMSEKIPTMPPLVIPNPHRRFRQATSIR